MWPFKKSNDGTDNSRTKLMDSESYAKLLNRIVERDADLSTLKSKMAAVELDINNLRGKLSQKLRDLQKEHKEEQAEKDLNDGYLPFG